MNAIKVRTMSYPARCEVCHQGDQFTPETGHCRRCEDIPLPQSIQNQETLTLPQRLAIKIARYFNTFPPTATPVKLMVGIFVTFTLLVFALMAVPEPTPVRAPSRPVIAPIDDNIARPLPPDIKVPPRFDDVDYSYVPARPDIFNPPPARQASNK